MRLKHPPASRVGGKPVETLRSAAMNGGADITRLMEVISELRSENLTVLISESDYTHSEKLVDDVFIIERGSVEFAQKAA